MLTNTLKQVRSFFLDISGKEEYNYEYEEGRIVRTTEANIELSGEIVTIAAPLLQLIYSALVMCFS